MNYYWEEYSDQNPNEFTHIGVDSQYELIKDLERQIADLKRRFGRTCVVKIAREMCA